MRVIAEKCLCDDCTIYACNGDVSGIDDDDRAHKVMAGVADLGAHLVPDFCSETGHGIDEFSRERCDGCGTRLAGSRHAFAILGE